MKLSTRTSLVVLPGALAIAAGLSFVTLAHGAQTDQRAHGGSGGLVKVAPPSGGPTARPLDEELDPDTWVKRLQASDLGEREANFDNLLDLARRDARARQLVESLAAESTDSEVAWTARLLLRELRQEANDPFLMTFHGFPWGNGSGFDLDRFFADLDPFGPGRGPADLDRLFQNLPMTSAPGAPGSSSKAESLSVEQTEDGWRIVLKENVNGEETTREFTGKSLEEILDANPDLRDKLDASGQGGLFHLELRPGLFGSGGMQALPFGADDGLQRDFFLRSPSRPQRTDVLGVRVAPVEATEAKSLGLDEGVGLVVATTLPGTLADVLGVRSGDVLIELNGRTLKSAADISEVLRDRAADADVVLTWIEPNGSRETRTWSPEKGNRGGKEF